MPWPLELAGARTRGGGYCNGAVTTGHSVALPCAVGVDQTPDLGQGTPGVAGLPEYGESRVVGREVK